MEFRDEKEQIREEQRQRDAERFPKMREQSVKKFEYPQEV